MTRDSLDLLRGKLVRLCVLVLSISLCSCHEDYSKYTEAVADIWEHRRQVEDYVRDIKRRMQPTQEAYKQAESKYVAAYSAYEGYMSALRVAILLNSPISALTPSSESARAASEEFMSFARESLSSSEGSRAITFKTLLTLPFVIHDAVSKMRDEQRRELLSRLNAELKWRTWSDIQ